MTSPTAEQPTEAVRKRQEARIREGIRQADAGEFLTHEQVKSIVKKYVPDG